MKRTFLVLLAFVLAVSMVACGGRSKDSRRDDDGSSKDTTPSSSAPAATNNPGEVTIVIPAFLFGTYEHIRGDLASPQTFVETLEHESGVISAEVNADNTVTLVVTEEYQQSSLHGFDVNFDDWIDEILWERTYPCLDFITHSSDFQEVKILVYKETYDRSIVEGLTEYPGVFAVLCRCFLGDTNPVITFVIVDNQTGDPFDTLYFPAK